MLNRKRVTEIETSQAYRCPHLGLLALDGWTWYLEQEKTNGDAILCSKWQNGGCNECSTGLKQMTETKR